MRGASVVHGSVSPGQLRWTVIGILSLICAQVSYFTISILLPKALVDQGTAITLSFGLGSLVFLASIPGKGFTGFIMEVIGRRWTITWVPCRIDSLSSADGDGRKRRSHRR
jgi:hypothetical protein